MKINEYYDVFISFKDSDEKGNDTKDKAIANELYEYLTSKNLKVFFSSDTFEKHGTDQWENELKKAMNASKVFISLGTKKSYMMSQYLLWERTFFSALRSTDDSRAMYSYITLPMTLDDLPIDMKSMSVFTPKDKEKLYKYIFNHINSIEKVEVATTKLEQLFTFISSIYRPFIVTFIILVMLSNFIYPSLELSDTIYTFLVLSFIISKVFVFFVKKARG